MHSLALLVLLTGMSVLGESADTDRARIIDSDTDRTPLQTVVPAYPEKARRDRIEGEVQVCFDIDRAGRTRRVAVRRSTHRIFERPSIQAVKASTFRPLDDDQALQAIKSCRTFVFELQPVERS
ncbi:MAG TPA: energy transducer TonB [Woeseiaceae bacterium]|nr:energy transducer TonB [Woeseiaceae bacterium]